MSLNPLKRVKFISIAIWSCFFQAYREKASQSPQTGQVYFYVDLYDKGWMMALRSQSPQTGQVYFNEWGGAFSSYRGGNLSQSPQTGQVYFNLVILEEI